jgi:PPOX class probable FMN-dependent enzyme
MNDIPDPAALRAHMGQINPMAARKVLPRLDRHCRRFIELSPFLVLATADADGGVDASPRGDPPGFVQIVDDSTLIIPDRPGNNRVDSFGNVLSAPGVGLIFFVPGIDETLRVNGTARLLAEQDALAGLEVNGKAPRMSRRPFSIAARR